MDPRPYRLSIELEPDGLEIIRPHDTIHLAMEDAKSCVRFGCVIEDLSKDLSRYECTIIPIHRVRSFRIYRVKD